MFMSCQCWVRQKQGLHALLAVMGKGVCDLIHALFAGEATPLTPVSLFSPGYLILTCTCKRIPLAVS